MQPPSVTPSRGHSSWQGALLTVSLLLSSSPSTTAQLTLESVPRAAAEGQDVLLRNPSRAEAIFYMWYKGDSLEAKDRIVTYMVSPGTVYEGPNHTGREIIYANGSWLLKNVTLADRGTYTLQIMKSDGVPEKLTGQIHVFQALVKPSIQVSNTTVTQTTGTVVFTCLTKHNGISISWFHEGERLRLTERMKLSQDNSSLTMNPVRMEDAGKYQCEVSNPGSAIRSDSIILTVDGDGSKGGRVLSAGTITGIVIGGLVGVLLVAALGYFLLLSGTRGSQSDPGHQQPPASTSGRGKSDNSASMHPLYANQAAVPIYEDLLKPDTNIYCKIHPR